MKIASSYPFLYEPRRLNYALLASIYYWYKKDYEKAINFSNLGIKNSISELPTFFYYIMGLAKIKTNNIEQAKSYLERVISMSLEDSGYSNQNLGVNARIALGKLARSQMDKELTFYHYGKALQILGKSHKSGKITSTVYFEQGTNYLLFNKDYDKALDLVQQSIILGCKTFSDTSWFVNPEIPDIIYHTQLINAFKFKAYVFYLLYEKNEKNLNYLKESLKCQEISVQLFERILFND